MVMAGPRSRFEPPRPDDRHIHRPRLLAETSKRWEARLTLLVAGAGGGKTALLAQAISENNLAPLGTDHWLSCGRPHNDPTHLLRDLSTALRLPTPSSDISGLLEALYGLPGTHALHLDDVHQVDSEAAAEVLSELLRHAPPNLHLIIASRTEPQLPLRRLEAQGSIVRIETDDFAFDPDERHKVSDRLSTSLESIASVGGWPALAALQAQAGSDGPVQFLLEEILHTLSADDRDEVAVLVAMGGASPAEMEQALQRPSRLAALARTLPLLHTRSDGTVIAHDLWSELGRLVAADIDTESVRARAAEAVMNNGDFNRAFDLLITSADPSQAVAVVVRAVTVSVMSPSSSVLSSWRERLPADLASGPVASLLDGMVAFSNSDMGEPTRECFLNSVEMARADGSVEVEVAALIMGILVTQLRNEPQLRLPLLVRLGELSEQGEPSAGSSTPMAEAAIHMLGDDDAAGLACLDQLDPADLPTQWLALAEGMRSHMLMMLGRDDEAMISATRHGELSSGDGAAATIMPQFFSGIDRKLVRLLEAIDERGISSVGYGVLKCYAEIVQAWCGRPPPAGGRTRRPFGDADAPEMVLTLAQAHAVDLIGQGDIAAASVELSEALENAPAPTAWRCVRRFSGLSYVLLPSWRSRLEAADLPGRLGQDLGQGMKLAYLREGGEPPRLRRGHPGERSIADLDWEEPEQLWRALPHGLVTEVMLRRFASADDPGITALVDHLALIAPEATWDFVRQIADGTGPDDASAAHSNGEASRRHDGGLVEAAGAFLSSTPAPFLSPVTLRLLGPTELVVGDEVVDSPELQKRKRVRQLLALLGVERSVERSRVQGVLWPDSPESGAAANLRTNLRHLLAAIEPARRPGEAAFLVRTVGSRLELAGPAYVTTDVELAEAAIREAESLLDAGAPTEAMRRFERVVDLWRGRPLEDLADLAEFGPDAERLNARLVAAAVRAAEIRLARGETDEASRLASRALAGDPWSEPAHRVSVEAALQQGDVALARRMATACADMLAEFGVEPAEETTMVLRRASEPAQAGAARSTPTEVS